MTNDLMREYIKDGLGMKMQPWQHEFMQALMDDAQQPSPALAAMQAIQPRAGYEIDWISVDGTNDIRAVHVPADPRERALWAKQRRGTGPVVPAKERGLVTKYKEKF